MRGGMVVGGGGGGGVMKMGEGGYEVMSSRGYIPTTRM
jgi:hypothetical protein